MSIFPTVLGHKECWWNSSDFLEEIIPIINQKIASYQKVWELLKITSHVEKLCPILIDSVIGWIMTNPLKMSLS